MEQQNLSKNLIYLKRDSPRYGVFSVHSKIQEQILDLL
jgi:hypothetical protein